jgi:hypothetical protein
MLFGHEDRGALNQLSVAMRAIRRDIWIEAALRNKSTDRIVFDSIRYRTDAEVLRASGFSLWEIQCPSCVAINRLRSRGQTFSEDDLSHASEVELSDTRFDTCIDNGERDWAAVCGEIDVVVRALLTGSARENSSNY